MINSGMIQAGVTKRNVLGVTLIELMIAVALFSVTFGAVYVVARTTVDNAAFHEAQLTAQEEARRALRVVLTELRQARGPSLVGQSIPNDQLTFQVPGDADGNGLPLDIGGYLESVGTVTYTRDWTDLNAEGMTSDQLVRVYRDDTGWPTGVTVLANELTPNEGMVRVDG